MLALRWSPPNRHLGCEGVKTQNPRTGGSQRPLVHHRPLTNFLSSHHLKRCRMMPASAPQLLGTASALPSCPPCPRPLWSGTSPPISQQGHGIHHHWRWIKTKQLCIPFQPSQQLSHLTPPLRWTGLPVSGPAAGCRGGQGVQTHHAHVATVHT